MSKRPTKKQIAANLEFYDPHPARRTTMAEVIELHRQDDANGLCRQCRRMDGYLNVGRDHIAVCHQHRVKWRFGSNLFSSWIYETDQDWLANEAKLANYRTVEPYFHPRRPSPPAA